jgi:hypothetical protein
MSVGDLDGPAGDGNGIALGDQLLTGFELRMICSAVCVVRFMVESPAQFGRMRTLIYIKPAIGVYIS